MITKLSRVFRSGKMQPHEKVVVLKPVASRPFSRFRPFPKVLQDFNATCSPTITIPEETELIRPKATQLASLPGNLPTQIAATIVSLTLVLCFGKTFHVF